MIERIAGAAALAAAGTAGVVSQPTTLTFFGMPFEVPAMIAALFGCIATRVIVGQTDKVSKWSVRVPVDVLSIGVTFFIAISVHPSVITALVLGITLAAIGAGVIKIFETRGRRLLDAILPGGDYERSEHLVQRLDSAAPSRGESSADPTPTEPRP